MRIIPICADALRSITHVSQKFDIRNKFCAFFEKLSHLIVVGRLTNVR